MFISVYSQAKLSYCCTGDTTACIVVARQQTTLFLSKWNLEKMGQYQIRISSMQPSYLGTDLRIPFSELASAVRGRLSTSD